MKEVIKFLQDNSVLFFATVGLDGRPKVRPFQFMLEENGKLYFCTSNQKNVYAEMQKQKYIELCSSSPEFVWIRLSGKAIFVNNLAIKEKIIEDNPLVKSIYKEASNPIFEIFYLDEAKAVLADFTGNPPKQYMF